MMATRRRFMEGTLHAAMLSVLGNRVFGAQAASGSYALNPAFEYLKKWVAPTAPYTPDGPMVLKYDIINWMGEGGPHNTVIGKLILSRLRREQGRVAFRVDCACGQDHWVSEVTCLDDVWNTPEEWTFTSKPLSPDTNCRNLVENRFKGIRKKTELELTWAGGRKKSIPFSGPILFPFALLASPEKWARSSAADQPMNALRELHYLMPDQRFIADGTVVLTDGSSLGSFLQYGPGGIPVNYVSGPTGLPLAMTGFLISYLLTDAEIGGAA
ncbi:hypothetical protein [Tichowtungia aerotolerans]|uniref:Uncharacterized protein n=1 Tax=Tichowtungia aerotolerans TaxID=2697043 RepID=A0A6P1ME03_9BACT|nr:hypothetical protein [Tichowtungia aerotolerans]QHI69826.1 hypothetical protein GT409_10315 [Tichowtungia aerotolerans]